MWQELALERDDTADVAHGVNLTGDPMCGEVVNGLA